MDGELIWASVRECPPRRFVPGRSYAKVCG
jgi:hypothetical protein